MSDVWQSKKIDLTSTAIEKGIDLAKDFLDKLIMPAVKETGLLASERVALWRFNNQVNVLIKARAKCIKAGIDPGSISLKLLVPLLENASLEESEEMQDVWATMLSNMVDSHQSLQNHVFPYLLSQLSIDEWEVIKHIYTKYGELKSEISKELPELNAVIETLEAEWEAEKECSDKENRGPEGLDVIRNKLRPYRERFDEIDYLLKSNPEIHWEKLSEEHHLPNLIRLGICKRTPIYRAKLSKNRRFSFKVKDPLREDNVQIKLNNENEVFHLTKLGESFIRCCIEKSEQQ